ncbi:MAG: potassium transporter TrkG [Cytophagales bacterium]|nr:potassium transporter TrkG [Cytophagales bacterium]
MKRNIMDHVKHSAWYNIVMQYRKFQISLSPQQNLLFGFATYASIDCLLLCIPIFQTQPVGWIDNLFTATSAISTTGLVTISIVDNYTWWGQAIILGLIQIGGVGYMTFTSFVMLSLKSNLTHWHQRVLNSEFSMPKGFRIQDFLRAVIVFTILIEYPGCGGIVYCFSRCRRGAQLCNLE